MGSIEVYVVFTVVFTVVFEFVLDVVVLDIISVIGGKEVNCISTQTILAQVSTVG